MHANQKTPIAFLGMGLMGTRMASRLLHAGYSVAVWNRSPHACEPLLQQGASLLAIDQIALYPVILTCLADDQAMQSVFAQIQPYLQAQQVIVDFSSLSVPATQQLAQSAQQQQVTWIDSPVSGGTIGAEQGTLVFLLAVMQKPSSSSPRFTMYCRSV